MSLQFDDATIGRLDALYQTPDIVRRRDAALNALDLSSGERVLDIGPGPGYLARQMAEQVGSAGEILGIDNSEPMVQLARDRCKDLPWVGFESGNATGLAVPDESFDAVISVQVFEYIADIQGALTEMYRVLRPGGRAVVVATDWDATIWHSSDQERMRKVLQAWGEHCAFTDLPRTLGAKMKQAGFNLIKQDVIIQFNPVFGPDALSYYVIDLIQAYVPGHNGVTETEVSAWAEDLRQLGERDEYFFCLNQFLYLATK